MSQGDPISFLRTNCPRDAANLSPQALKPEGCGRQPVKSKEDPTSRADEFTKYVPQNPPLMQAYIRTSSSNVVQASDPPQFHPVPFFYAPSMRSGSAHCRPHIAAFNQATNQTWQQLARFDSQHPNDKEITVFFLAHNTIWDDFNCVKNQRRACRAWYIPISLCCSRFIRVRKYIFRKNSTVEKVERGARCTPADITAVEISGKIKTLGAKSLACDMRLTLRSTSLPSALYSQAGNRTCHLLTSLADQHHSEYIERGARSTPADSARAPGTAAGIPGSTPGVRISR
ncbi:hypothetical protein B0H16DRAFT_1476261 [Mycena metata]|uniref:Uncharacterized protein n=1 Tax=Mycena metata TaxID=1033252 RepID=A0AAD7MH41_9AGAR|nr:hypothetical protein B0H16DRAFT_1476261 [Mycena metata]